jgi:hypothetical protein
MSAEKSRSFWQLRWGFPIIYISFIILVVGLVFVIFSTNILDTSRAGEVPPLIWFGLALLMLFTLILVLSRAFKIIDMLYDVNTKLERMTNMLERERAGVVSVQAPVNLRPQAAAVAAGSGAIRMKAPVPQAGASEPAAAAGPQMVKAIAYIEELIENRRWVEANEEIESLIKLYPNHSQAKALRQMLADKKDERKKLLLTAWDDAVKRGATDRSLEILKELDSYLTPNEGLALQEAAKDVFKTKLHNLGIQFTLAAAGNNWAKALEIGTHIIGDFPNSKMAVEIREKMEALKQKVEKQA